MRWVSGARQMLRDGLVVAALWSAAWGASAQIVNGGFESGGLAPFVSFVSSGAPGVGGAGVFTSMGPVTPHSGTYFAGAFDNGGEGFLAQSLATVPGASYTVSVWLATTFSPPPNTARIGLGIVASAPCTLAAGGAWTLCTANFTATSTSEIVFLYFQTQIGTGFVLFDDVSVTLAASTPAQPQQVPTLAPWMLAGLALALGGLAVRRLRRA